MRIDTIFLRRCIDTLELALEHLQGVAEEDIIYDLHRAACVKEFELVLEQSGKLLRKRLTPYFASNRQADRLVFKDLFRHAAKHGLLDTGAVERWLRYRDNRSQTAHDYGSGFADATLKLLRGFVADANALAAMIESDPMADRAASVPQAPRRDRGTVAQAPPRHRSVGLRQPGDRPQPRRQRPRPSTARDARTLV